jgi:hypothetical protein
MHSVAGDARAGRESDARFESRVVALRGTASSSSVWTNERTNERTNDSIGFTRSTSVEVTREERRETSIDADRRGVSAGRR